MLIIKSILEKTCKNQHARALKKQMHKTALYGGLAGKTGTPLHAGKTSRALK